MVSRPISCISKTVPMTNLPLLVKGRGEHGRNISAGPIVYRFVVFVPFLDPTLVNMGSAQFPILCNVRVKTFVPVQAVFF